MSQRRKDILRSSDVQILLQNPNLEDGTTRENHIGFSGNDHFLQRNRGSRNPADALFVTKKATMQRTVQTRRTNQAD